MGKILKNIFIIKINTSMILTFLGVLFGIFSLYFSNLKNIKFAFIFLCLAGMCDAFDGTFANKFDRTNDDKLMGIQFDSLTDIFVSGVVPVCILLSMGFTNIYNIIVYFLFISCGIYRLSFYNTFTSKSPYYFVGLPITTSTIVFPVLYLFTQSQIIFIIAMALLALLYVLNIKIKKAGVVLRILLSLIGIVTITYVIIMNVNFTI